MPPAGCHVHPCAEGGRPATWATRDAAGFQRSRSPAKPTSNHHRAERDRAKKAAKDAKLRERKEQAALRKASETGGAEPSAAPAQGSGE